MDFGNLREMSVKIVHSVSGCIMTTANGMRPAFSGRHPKLFIVSDLYRVVTEIAEVHADIARVF